MNNINIGFDTIKEMKNIGEILNFAKQMGCNEDE